MADTDTTTHDEFSRQRALDRYRILDTLPETTYDDIVRLASTLCDTPIALVSLIDRDRQWFKAQVGLEALEATETSRDVAFCDHAIRTPSTMLEIEDARGDTRFADNPFVTGDPSVRFYAGMPLVAPGGEAIGTVCVIDSEPRVLSDEQRAALESLARLTMALLEGRGRELEAERGALLQQAAPAVEAPGPGPAALPGFTVSIIEIQDYAGTATRIGERALQRALEQLDTALEAAMRGSAGDVVNRVTGSAEYIAVLHGEDTAAAAAALRDTAQREAEKLGLRVVVAEAAAADGGEAMERVYLRADQALSRAKSAH